MSRTAQPVFLGLYNGSPFLSPPPLVPAAFSSLPHPVSRPLALHPSLSLTVLLSRVLRPFHVSPPSPSRSGCVPGLASHFYEATPAVRSGTPASLLLSLPSRSSLRAYLWIRLPGRRADRKFRIPQLYGSLRACKRPEETLGARMCVSRRRNTNGHRVRRRRCAKMNEF